MKKKLVKRMLAVTLAASMVIAMAACGDNDSKGSGSGGQQDGVGGNSGADADDEFDDTSFEKYIQGEVVEDLGGYVFKILDFGASRWYPTDGEIKSLEDQLKVDIISNVEATYNCKIEIEDVEAGQVFGNVQPEVLSGDKCADLIGVTEWGFGTLLAADLLMDMSTVDSIDLSADYWNKNVVDFLTFGGKTYGVGGAFGPDFGNEGVIFYNRRIWDELTLADGSKLPEPADLLDNNEWTWDKLLEFAKAAVRDQDGDGKVDSEADRYGIVGPIAAIYERYVTGVGESFIDKASDGTMTMGLQSSAAAEKLNWLYSFFNNENVVGFVHAWDYIDTFAAGGSLFMLYGNTGDDKLREMEDDWGILPIPKWSADQDDYWCEVDSNAPVFCMTYTNTNAHEAGVILSALARRFQAVEKMFINDRLDTLYRLDETEYIVNNYIWKHAGYEPVSLIKTTSPIFGRPTAILEMAANGQITDTVSELKAYEEQINTELAEFFEKK